MTDDQRRIELEPDGVLYWYPKQGWLLLTVDRSEPTDYARALVEWWPLHVQERDGHAEAQLRAEAWLREINGCYGVAGARDMRDGDTVPFWPHSHNTP